MAVQTHAGRRRYVLVLIVLTALTLATLDKRSNESGPIGTVGRFAHRVVQPFANAADTVFSPVHDWWDGLIHSGHLKSENRTLRHEIAQLEARVRDSDAAVLQLRYYQSYFGQPFLDAYKTVGAQIVTGKVSNLGGNTVTIDRGQEVGIIPDNAVVAPEGLVGVISKSWHGGALVDLIDDPGFGAAIQINGVFGTAQTQNDGTMRVVFSINTRAPARTRPKAGDVALTCGCQDSNFPAGVPVGTVTRVVQDGPAVTVTVQPFIDTGSLDVAKVVLWTSASPRPVPPVPPATTVQPNTPTVPTASTSTSTVPPTTTTTPGATTTSTGAGP